jgi:hypothetical protein
MTSSTSTAPTALLIPGAGDAQPQAFAGTGGPTVDYTPFVFAVGSEILVNTTTLNMQFNQKVTALANGTFVVTWYDNSFEGADTSGGAVKAQIFSATGVPIGTEFLVNTATDNGQYDPQVAALPDGGFVIVWTDQGASATKAQVFDAAGAPTGLEIVVNTNSGGNDPQVTTLANGGFVVTWEAGGAPGDNSGLAISAQIFTAAGVPVGGEILVNTATDNAQEEPQITALADGGFVVTWQDSSMGVGGASGDSSFFAVKAQVFTAVGGLVGTEILVNTATTEDQNQPRIVALPNGGFVVTWQDVSEGDGGANGDASNQAVKAQVFTADGLKTGAEILVNTATDFSQYAPEITVLANGDFVITWTDGSGGFAGAPGDESSVAVKAQVFTESGAMVGTEILVNTATEDAQMAPKITALATGGFVITWEDFSLGAGGAAGDGSSWAVKAQVFTAAGLPLGTEILVNTATTNQQEDPEITALPNGGFVITWEDFSQGDGGASGDTSSTAVKAQVFNIGYGAVEQVPLDLRYSGFSVSDADPGDTLTVTLTSPYGAFNLHAGDLTLDATGQGTGTLTITGAANQIGALFYFGFFSDIPVLSFTADTDTPPATTTITLTADDGAGGVASTSAVIAIQAVPDAGPTTGDDIVTGTTGDDDLSGLAGADDLDGGDGDDFLDGGEGDDTLVGGTGQDYLRGGDGGDTLRGGAGDDTYVVENLGDTTDETGGDGVDLVHSRISWTLGAGLENLTLGSAGGDIDGTGNGVANVITGNAGDNSLSGLAGDDTLLGAGGQDTLDGGAGLDSLDGGNGNDILLGGADADDLVGGAGNDRLDGGTGGDDMVGGLGNDTYVVDSLSDTVTELANGGIDTVESSVTWTLAGNVENLTLTGTAMAVGFGNDGRNILIGNSAGNVLVGGGDVDTISGEGGGDNMFGGLGNDILSGGDGVDVLSGGEGNDRMTGGADADWFLFGYDELAGAGVARDEILDLDFAEGDVISLTTLDADPATGGDQAFTWAAGNRFTKHAGELTLKYVAATNITTLEMDIDGDGKADLRIAITGDHSGTTGNLYTGVGDTDGGWLL